MNLGLKRGIWIIIPAIFVMTVLSIMSIWSPEATVVADTPPPMLPEFDGADFSGLLNAKLLNQQPISISTEATGWSLVLSETFTTTLDTMMWSAIDNDSASNGEYYWATGVFSNTGMTDTVSARAISGGADGMSVTETDGYPDNADSWLVLGPFSTEGANAAVITFDYFFDAAIGDFFGVAVSTDGGLNYVGKEQNGGLASNGWQSVSYNLNDVVGESAVYVAFIFTSDGSGNTNNRLGAYVDNVNLYMSFSLSTYLPFINKAFTPTPTSTPVPTNTPTPVPVLDHYRDDFDDPDSGWEMRRTDISNTSDWAVKYRSDEQLELEVDNTSNYIIVSPLVEAPEPPYNIELKARFGTDSDDRHIYGIVFAADWNGTACPNNVYTSCFNKYHWLRVEWDESDPGNPFLEFMMRRIHSHNANNSPQGVDLLGWKKLNNASPTGWHEWDILVEENGKISISFDDNLVATTTSTTDIGLPYFGVMLETRHEGGAYAKFDYFKYDAVD